MPGFALSREIKEVLEPCGVFAFSWRQKKDWTPGPHDLKSRRFFDLLKTSEASENKGIFLFLLNEQKARRNPPGPDRP